MDKVSYALGIGIGRQLSQMGAADLSIDDFAQAIKDVIAGDLKLGDAEAQQIVQEFFAKQEEKQKAEAAEKGKAAKQDGEKFLAENGKRKVLSRQLRGCNTRFCVKETVKVQRQPTQLSVIMKAL